MHILFHPNKIAAAAGMGALTSAAGIGGLGAATLAGAASGAAAGFTGGFLNTVAFGGSSGYFSGDVGDAFAAGAQGMWKGALIGGASGAAMHIGKTVWNNTRGSWSAEFSESVGGGEGPMSPSSERAGVDFEKDLHSKFKKYAGTNPNKGGESAGYYKIKKSIFSDKYYVDDLAKQHFKGTSNRFAYRGISKPDVFIHSHPNTSYPSFSGVKHDYSGALKLLRNNITPYLLGADQNLYMISGSANTGYFHITF